MSNLLISEPPLQVLPSLAVKIGLNEAIILQQFHYWLQRSNNVRDGRRWIYNSYPEWNKQFPFWSKNTMIKAFKSLEKQGLIITGNYNKAGFDKTKWYSIDYSVLELLNDESSVVDDEPETGRRSTRNGFMEEPETGRPIPRDYQETTTDKNNNNEKQENSEQYETALKFYEMNFGVLGSYMIQSILYWVKDTSDEVVIAAMKKALARNVHNWSYVETVLKDWVSRNITTIDQVKADDVDFQNKKEEKKSKSKSSKQGAKYEAGDDGYRKMREREDKGELPF